MARAKAQDHRAQLAVIGILPTLADRHLVEDAISPDDRYLLLNEQMLTDRGEPIRLDITGGDPLASAPEHLVADFDSIAPEAACTSMQLHLQVAPEVFPAYWNAAQCLAGVQLAVGANSRSCSVRGCGPRPASRCSSSRATCARPSCATRAYGRGWFGERWIESVLDLFAENSRYFRPDPRDGRREPARRTGRGPGPALSSSSCTTARCGGGTGPCTTSRGLPHIRLENRVLPRPGRRSTWWRTRCSSTAAAGAGRGRAAAVELHVLDAAHENFTSAARNGLDATLYWPGTGWIHPDELVLRKLLPLAAEGWLAGASPRGVRPLPADDRAALPDQPDRRVVAGRGGRGAGRPRREPNRCAARHVRAVPGALGRERAGAQLALPR